MTERKSILLRIDPGLWTDIDAWARDEMRSINGQIEYLLKQAVIGRKRQRAKETLLTPPPEEENVQGVDVD